jgi:purine-nucleoside phosphorylase
MGMPSMSIYANELIRDYGARTLIRVGSAGAMQPDIAVRDIVLAQAAPRCPPRRAGCCAS